MELINANASSLIQLNNLKSTQNLSQILNKNGYTLQGNETAFNVEPGIMGRLTKFDNIMENIGFFKDIICTAQDGVGEMFSEGESIRSLLEKAREENLSPESMDALEKEVNSRLEQINRIKNSTNFNGVNPFQNPISLNIPDWQSIFTNGLFDNEVVSEEKDTEPSEESMKNVIAEFNVDMKIDGSSDNNSFSMGASAKIQIGYNDDGSLQITVDATMDFDLSGIMENGVKSDNSFDLINQFLDFLKGLGDDLGTASNMFDSMVASGTASIIGDGFAINASNDINIEQESSSSLKGQIVQHASITLDSTANQSPGIAINLL